MKVKEPPSGIIITIIKRENYFVAECKSVEQFGTGDTWLGALEDLVNSMREDYQLLLEHKDRLSKYAQSHLDIYKWSD